MRASFERLRALPLASLQIKSEAPILTPRSTLFSFSFPIQSFSERCGSFFLPPVFSFHAKRFSTRRKTLLYRQLRLLCVAVCLATGRITSADVIEKKRGVKRCFFVGEVLRRFNRHPPIPLRWIGRFPLGRV